MGIQFGSVLKAQRKVKNLTLKQLAEETGLSAAYLSLLERNMNSPTVENLNRVCAALGLTLGDLIEEASSTPDIVVKADERAVVFQGPGFCYEAATNGERQLSCLVMTISDTNYHLSNAHVADEIGYIVSGSITLEVNGTAYPLSTGDAIYIEANQPHGYYKTSAEDCVSLWIYGSAQKFEVPLVNPK